MVWKCTLVALVIGLASTATPAKAAQMSFDRPAAHAVALKKGKKLKAGHHLKKHLKHRKKHK